MLRFGLLIKTLRFAILCIAASGVAQAQDLDLPVGALDDGQHMSEAMPRLAEQAIAVYRNDARDAYLNVLFRLQLVAGQYDEAQTSIHALRELRRGSDPHALSTFVQYEVYAKAKTKQQSTTGLAFDEAFAQAFRDVFGRLDDQAAEYVAFSFGANVTMMADDLQRAVEAQKGTSHIGLADALALIRAYQVHQVYEQIVPRAEALIAEDDRRRYIVEEDIPVKTHDGAVVAAMLVRPKSASAPIPALLTFTIYANRDGSFREAKQSAAHGYAGVVAYTRGKGISPETPIPCEHDGADAADVIDWISKQPWSDKRVGMFGGSYEGFTQWAAAKHLPPALKAIMPSVPVAPGIDWPMEGNVFQNYTYKWLPYVTNTKALDDATYGDSVRWTALDRRWYTTGQPYRSLDRIDGTPNPIFRRWLDHPSYDEYWRRMIPYGKEFANIDIPVLTTTGYYDGCLISARYYFAEHTKHNPRAEHYLLVGPYDHIGAQRRSVNVLQGYRIDPVASIDIENLRYEWFDYVLKGGAKPDLLKDRVNYEVMGANEWKHAPSLAAMANASIRFHLSGARADGGYRLARKKPSGKTSIRQTVDFADRSDVERADFSPIINRTIDSSNGLVFVSDPVAQSTEISGLFSGVLDFVANKRDMDLNVSLYELTPAGEYFQLSYYLGRASYIPDPTRRRLLTPGKRQRLAFVCGRLTSRHVQPGSRLVVVLRINKQLDAQINYGTGKDASDESIADAATPLEITWYGDSYIDVPVWKTPGGP